MNKGKTAMMEKRNGSKQKFRFCLTCGLVTLILEKKCMICQKEWILDDCKITKYARTKTS